MGEMLHEFSGKVECCSERCPGEDFCQRIAALADIGSWL